MLGLKLFGGGRGYETAKKDKNSNSIGKGILYFFKVYEMVFWQYKIC